MGILTAAVMVFTHVSITGMAIGHIMLILVLWHSTWELRTPRSIGVRLLPRAVILVGPQDPICTLKRD